MENFTKIMNTKFREFLSVFQSQSRWKATPNFHSL